MNIITCKIGCSTAMFLIMLAFRETITYLLCRPLCEIYQDGVPYDQHGWIENFVPQKLRRKISIALRLCKTLLLWKFGQ